MAGAGRRRRRTAPPTLAAHRRVADTDWEASFRQGLAYLLTGMREHAGRGHADA